MDGGGKMLARASFAQSRPDVATALGNPYWAASGFTALFTFSADVDRSQYASAGWRLTFKPTQFQANTYLMFAYVRSAVSGKEDNAVRFFAIREQ